jgi:hypothetical protein
MLWTVAARFHLDGGAWSIRRLEFWYRGANALYREEQDAIAELRKESGGGRN